MADIVRSMINGVERGSSKENKYLIFTLGNEEYGISILKVKEIVGMVPITSMPHTPKYVKGVINLRGTIYPVIDLRQKFGMSAVIDTERTSIIMVEIANRYHKMLTGIIVDSVSEVISIKNENIEATPGFGADLNMEFILGIAKLEGMVKILLNIDRTLNTDEIALPLMSSPCECIMH